MTAASSWPRFRLRGTNLEVLLGYTAAAVVMTWPLATRLGREIAWDLGDPVFNCWVMMWTGGQLIAALGGQFNALHSFWNGNIFSPERLTIAYSEHLTPQMLQILPSVRRDGQHRPLLQPAVSVDVRLFRFRRRISGARLTGRRLAGVLAGLAFAFAPYRISRYSHLQVLSTYWMPLALYGLRRYFATRRTRPLVGAAAALIAAEPLVRLLPAVLPAVCRRVLPVRDRPAPPASRRANLGVARIGGDRRRGDHVAVCLAVLWNSALGRRRDSEPGRSGGVLRGSARVCHGVGILVGVGPSGSRLSQGRGGGISRLHDSDAGDHRPRGRRPDARRRDTRQEVGGDLLHVGGGRCGTPRARADHSRRRPGDRHRPLSAGSSRTSRDSTASACPHGI